MPDKEKMRDAIKEMTPGIPGESPGSGQREIYLHRLEPEDIECIVSRFLARRQRCLSCSRPGCTDSVLCEQAGTAKQPGPEGDSRG